MSNITVSRREAGDGAKPYVVLIDGQPWLDRQNHPRRFGNYVRAWNAAIKIKPAVPVAERPTPQEAAPAQAPASTRPYGCIDPADKLTHTDVRRIGLKPGPAPLTPEQVEAAYAARAEARAHARAGQAQAAPLQDGPGAELRCGAGYADDYRAYLADLDAAAALEARARQLEIQAAAPAPGPAAIPTEPDHDTGAQPMTPNTATPHPSMASTIAAHATLMERVKAEQTQALAQEQETAPEAAFAQAEQLIANRLAAHIDEIESFEEFKSFARGYFSQGMYNKLYYTNTLRAIWDARHPQRPEPAPQAPAQAAHGANDDMAGIRRALNIIKRGDPMLEPAAQEETVGAGASAVMLDEALGGDPTDEEIEENIEAQEREETLAIMAGEVKADPAPVHSKARWHEGFADGDADREPTHDVADYRSGWNHGAVCRAQREAAEAPGVEGVAPALVAVYGGSDMTEGEFSALADRMPESATVGDVIDAARSLRGLAAEGEPEAPADGEKDAPGTAQESSGGAASSASASDPGTAPVLPSYGALLAEYHLLAHAVAQLSDRLAAAEAIIEALRGPAPARPAEPPAPKPATPRAAVDVADSAPYKRGLAAARNGGKADADWFQGYEMGTADKAEGRASREAQMAGRSLRSGYVAGFTGANETTNARWVAGYKAGLRG
ncbi:hypothetical protein [Methylomagnum ishizawai]|uniref:hypothetical protein n=1 Tax=Methylomagnum ishizawai TaxID=1760988 RepID=UPI001C32F5BF|nr:hypothetical protein [Methylomagnum ishizawai]BBL75991.1 hypothetical protein MishRS11D_30890 [Methylomagnum ishizawai]